MASTREFELQLRRDELVQRSHELRQSLAAQTRRSRQPLAWAEHAHAGWHWLLAHPGWLAGGATGLLVLRPRRMLRLAGRVLQVTLLWQRLLPLWLALGARRR